MANKKHLPLFPNSLLVLLSLLVLTFTVSGCSKSEDTSRCQNIFTSNFFAQLPDNNSSGATESSRQNATIDVGTSAKISSLSSTEGDPDLERGLSRAPGAGAGDRDPDGTYRYTPDNRDYRSEDIRDRFEVAVSDRDYDFHVHGLRGLLGLLDRFGEHQENVPVRTD